MAVASEQGRVYRACINGQISTSDAARLAYQLKEIRCTREAINAEIALAKANEPPPPPGDFHLNILSIPSGRFLTAEQASADYKWELDNIESELPRLPPAEPEEFSAPAPVPANDGRPRAEALAAPKPEPAEPEWQDPPAPGPAPEPEENIFERAARETREQGGWIMAPPAPRKSRKSWYDRHHEP